MTFLATASGLTIDRVRSSAMGILRWAGHLRPEVNMKNPRLNTGLGEIAQRNSNVSPMFLQWFSLPDAASQHDFRRHQDHYQTSV